MSRDRDELMDHEADGIREFDNDLPAGGYMAST
jgi:hypothetical protein